MIDLWIQDESIPWGFSTERRNRCISGWRPRAAGASWKEFQQSSHGTLGTPESCPLSRNTGQATAYRLAWLADVVLALERQGGFPGGCPAKENLAAFVKLVKKPPAGHWDDLGRPALKAPASPLWKRWHISYAADLNAFRQRAEALVSLAKVEGRIVIDYLEGRRDTL